MKTQKSTAHLTRNKLLRCRISFCENFNGSTDHNVQMCNIPSDIELYQKWKKEIEKYEPFNHLSGYICSKHFTDDDIDQRTCVVKRGAIPTIFHQKNSTHKKCSQNNVCANQSDYSRIIRSEPRKRYCRFSFCENFRGRSDKNIGMFKIPTDKETFEKWKEATYGQISNTMGLVCHKHFAPDDVLYNENVKNRKYANAASWYTLKKGAIPIVHNVKIVDIAAIKGDSDNKDEVTQYSASENNEIEHIECEDDGTIELVVDKSDDAEYIEDDDERDSEDGDDVEMLCEKCESLKSELEKLRKIMTKMESKHESEVQLNNVKTEYLESKLVNLTLENKNLKEQVRKLQSQGSQLNDTNNEGFTVRIISKRKRPKN